MSRLIFSSLCILTAAGLMAAANRRDPRRAFERTVEAYLSASRALAQRLPLADPAEFKQRYDATLDLYGRIPAPPPAFDHKEIAYLLSQIGFNHSIAQVLANQRATYVRQGLRERARQMRLTLTRMQREQLQRIDQVAKLLKQ